MGLTECFRQPTPWRGLSGLPHRRFRDLRFRSFPNVLPIWKSAAQPARLARPASVARAKGTKTLFDLNRIGGVTEFAQLNHQALAVAPPGVEVCFHFRSIALEFYCGGWDPFAGMFPGVSEFNLARIALGLAMPTIFARTAPLKK